MSTKLMDTAVLAVIKPQKFSCLREIMPPCFDFEMLTHKFRIIISIRKCYKIPDS